MEPAIYNYGITVRGDTIALRTVTIVIDDIAANISSTRMMIRKEDQTLVTTLTPTISSNTVTIPAIAGSTTATFPIGTLKYDLEVTLSGGDVRTYIQGDIPIVTDYTH